MNEEKEEARAEKLHQAIEEVLTEVQ